MIMSDTVSIRYGKSELHVRLPKGCEPTIIRKPAMPVLPDPGEAIRNALLNPVAAPSIAELAKSLQRVCIVICDITRPVPNGPILKALIEQLVENGVALDRITILIATGLHRPNLGREMREVVGDDWVFDKVRVENHFARDRQGMVDLGRTPTDGIPVLLNRHLVDADLRIAVGLVEPHLWPGIQAVARLSHPALQAKRPSEHFIIIDSWLTHSHAMAI